MARLTLNLLGGFQATLNGVSLSGFASDKTRALLAYLAIESDRPHRRESLVGLLWPNVLEASARQSLSQALSNLRRVLGDSATELPFILTTRDTLQFNRASDYVLDVEQLAQAAERFAPLLDGFSIGDAEGFEEWVVVQRETLQRRALEHLSAQTDAALSAGAHAQAIKLARRQLEIDLWREEAHRQLMRAYALHGQRSDALAQYEKCKQVLRDELGIAPSAETETLYAQIKNEQLDRSQRDKETGRPAAQAAETPTSTDAQSASSTVTASARLRNLPTVLTPFVGRERELKALADLVANPEARLITLVGAGGIGKTRLATEVARQVYTYFTHGVVFAPLASVSQTAQVLPALAQALDLTVINQANLKAQVFNVLSQQHLLCVLDNLEQLVGDGATIELLMELLQATQHVKLLVTSREATAIQAEWVFDLDGLGADALTLFVQTARRVQVHWQATEADVKHIAQICQRVGGMPLGIELAASWLRVLSCAEIADEIERSIDFLASTARHTDERHRSITAVFDASWKMLTEAERRALEGLAVFQNGFTREAAKAVADASLPMLSALVSKSLVRRATSNRYDLHELVRQYAMQKLNEAGQYNSVRDRHQQYFVKVAQDTITAWLKGDRNVYNNLHPDTENLYLAIDWAFVEKASAPQRIAAIQILGMLPVYWRIVGHISTARAQLQQLLDAEDDLTTDLRGLAMHGAGHMALWQSNPAQAQVCFDETIRLIHTLPDPSIHHWTLAMSLLGLGEAASQQSNYTLALLRFNEGHARFVQLGDKWGISEALIGIARHTLDQDIEGSSLAKQRALLEQSVALKREINDTAGLAWALNWLSRVTQQMGDLAVTEQLHEESLRQQQALGDKFNMALTLNRMAELKRQQTDYPSAMRIYEQSVRLLGQIGMFRGLAEAQHNMGYICLIQGETSRAASYFKESLAFYQRMKNKKGIALALIGLGGVAAATERGGFAAVCLAAAQQLLKSVNYYLEPTDRVDYERGLAAARAQLSESEFDAAWAQGCAADYEQLAQAALQL